jgi:hypothetical protein
MMKASHSLGNILAIVSMSGSRSISVIVLYGQPQLQSPPHWPGILQPVLLVKGSAYQFSIVSVWPAEGVQVSSNLISAKNYFLYL